MAILPSFTVGEPSEALPTAGMRWVHILQRLYEESKAFLRDFRLNL